MDGLRSLMKLSTDLHRLTQIKNTGNAKQLILICANLGESVDPFFLAEIQVLSEILGGQAVWIRVSGATFPLRAKARRTELGPVALRSSGIGRECCPPTAEGPGGRF